MTRHGRGDVRFFDRMAGLYDRLMPAASVGEFAPAFAIAERPVRRVLDLAGGSGRVAGALQPAGYDPLVADVSAPMLARARRRGVDTVRADAGALPLSNGAVDAVVVVDAYHHLPDQQAALAEAARVLAPGGVAVIRDFDPSTLAGRGIEAGEALFGMGSRFVDADGAAAALTGAGLRSRVVERGTTYTVAGRKPE